MSKNKSKIFVICYKYETHAEAVLTAKDPFDAVSKFREVLPEVDITLVTEQTLVTEEKLNAAQSTASKGRKPNSEA